jgi:hypothetical protein
MEAVLIPLDCIFVDQTSHIELRINYNCNYGSLNNLTSIEIIEKTYIAF